MVEQQPTEMSDRDQTDSNNRLLVDAVVDVANKSRPIHVDESVEDVENRIQR